MLCLKKAQGFITSQDPKLKKVDDDNQKLVKQMDELAHDVMALIHRNQKERDIEETAPEIGTLVCFMNQDRKFTHLTSRLRHGLIAGLSPPIMDNVSRSAYIQTFLKAGSTVDHFTMDDKNMYVTLHRKLADIIVLNTTNEEQAEEAFKLDFQRLAKAMQSSEHSPIVEEDMEPLKLDQTIQRAPEKEKPSNYTETKPKDLPKTPRRSDRLVAKKNSTCRSGCCISLLALLLATRQATALTSPHPNGPSHFLANKSE